MIEEKKIKMEESKRNPYYSRINKFCFFYIIESICIKLKERIYEIIIDKDCDYINKTQFFNSIIYFSQNLLKLEKRFLLFSKEIFTLDIITKIISQILLKSKDLSILKTSSINLSNLFLMNNQQDKFINILNEQNSSLNIIFRENLDENSRLMNIILLNYYKSKSSKDLKKKGIEFLLKNNINHDKLIEYSYPLMQQIFKFSTLEPLKDGNKLKFEEHFKEDDIITKFINDKNDQKLNELFLYRFEIICDNYFKKILKNENNKDKYQDLCGNTSKDFLICAINNFYKIGDYKQVKLNNIFYYYCIAYIKRYLSYYINVLYDENSFQHFSDREEVNEILFAKNPKEKGRDTTIIYYCLKLLFKKHNNWEEFNDYYNNQISNNNDDIFELKKNKKEIEIGLESLKYLPTLLLDITKKENPYYIELLFENDLKKNEEIFNNLFLKNKSYEYLYTFMSNLLILYYCTDSKKENIEKKNNYKNLIMSIKEYLIKNNKISDKDILDFIILFFESEKINEKINKKIGLEGKKDEKKIIIILFALRFIFSMIINSEQKIINEEGLYFKLLTKNVLSIIDKGFIPGNFQNTNLKIQNFDEIKTNLTKEPLKYGAYLCSCGYHYTIDKCTFPTKEFDCPICRKKIGGKKHILVRRDGHIRIFFDEETRLNKINHSYADKEVPYKYLAQLENEINIEKKDLIKGLKPVNKVSFLKKEEKVREMSNITYRFLNFILYSFLFYSNIKEYIKDKNINKYVIESMTCFDIIEKDWDFMKEILEGELDVELFLNLIFDEIINKFINCPIFKTKEEAIQFEKEINEIITNKIKNKELIKEYKKLNEDIIKINPNSSKAIIQEIYPFTKYPELKELKYFYISEFPGEEDFKLKFNSKEKNKEKYPILNTIINDDKLQERIKLMKKLPLINKVCNEMINYASFKYSREEAKEILIKDELINNEIYNLLNEFIKIYKEIRPHIKQEGCHEFGDLYYELDIKNLHLSDLCVDSGEMGFGLVYLAIYKEMADWQNSFINVVINSSNEHLKYYKDSFNSKIMIQDCEEEQILNLPSFGIENDKSKDNNEKDNINLLEVILNNSYRKENKIIYDYDEIEDELANSILPKIRSFKSEFRKVKYQYECFEGDRITNFMEKYLQRELTENELKNIIIYINENQNNNKFNIKNFLFSLQYLIDIILDKSPDINETISSVIKNIDNIPSGEMTKDFFSTMNENMKNDKNNNSFTINCLININDIIEMFCWDIIRNNLDTQYLEDINENIKIQINSFFNEIITKDSKNNNTIILKKIHLCSAIRRLITRYLSGKSDENINPKNKLKNYLIKIELWPINFAESEIIEEEVNQIFGDLDILICHSLKLYDYLGGDKSELDKIKKKTNPVPDDINPPIPVNPPKPNPINLTNFNQPYPEPEPEPEPKSDSDSEVEKIEY